VDRRVRFLPTPWGRVAHAVVGSGPPLVFDTGWISDLDVMWAQPGYRAIVEKLAEHNTVVCFDPPGCGLSERQQVITDFDDEVALLTEMLAAAGVSAGNPATLFVSSIAASTAVRFAAQHPKSVSRLILFGATALGEALAPPDVRAALAELIRVHWGLGSRAISDLFVPGVRGDELEWFDDMQRRTTSGPTAAARLEMYYSTDVTADARRVRCPTLVLHRTGDRAVARRCDAQLASLIPGADFVTVGGDAHCCYLGDWPSVLESVTSFLADHRTGVAGGLPSGPYGTLTAREVDVAGLTVGGLTNAEIGEQIGISARTVETHLTRVRKKLGVRSRSEVAVWFDREVHP